MANTTWNPSDKSANVTLSGGNLVATGGTGTSSVRAIDKQITGKFYWECTCNTVANALTGVGVHSPGFVFTNGGYSTGGFFGTCGVIQSGGTIYRDGISTGIALGALAAGNVVCISLDTTSRLVWFRVGAAGNWNASASANPATASGGIAFTSLGGGIPIHPSAVLGPGSDQVTANFGDSAFTGAVPSGFTSGFTAGATIGTNELLTQLALEEWGSGTPTLQLTQVALEEWATVQTVTPQLVLTQIAIEEWASVAQAPSGGPIITMIN
jgi:hypothetical protein